MSVLEFDRERAARARAWPIAGRLQEELERERERDLRQGKPLVDLSPMDLVGEEQSLLLMALSIAMDVPGVDPLSLVEDRTEGEILELYMSTRARAYVARQVGQMEKEWREEKDRRARSGHSDNVEYLDPDR